jgi:CheY-like chemotaxis protein
MSLFVVNAEISNSIWRHCVATAEGNAAASILTALASLVSALAWPILVGTLFRAIYKNSKQIVENLNRFMEGKRSAKIGLSAAGGFSLEIVEKTASESANAVVESAKKSDTGPLSEAQIAQVATSAKSAAISLAPNAFDPKKRLRVLWVDDHPENNIDLQFAFQTLGIVVICIDSNDSLRRAFNDASGFDVVITDIGRDEIGGRREADPEGGLKTVEMIRNSHPDTKVIIYAGRWAASHRNDHLQAPVIQITNYTQEVYSTVVDLAKEKAA